MWLYSAILLTAIAYVACYSAQLNTKKRTKQDGNRIATASQRRRYRLSSDDTEEVQVPMKIPKLSRAQKIALIIESGQDPFEKRRFYGRRRKDKGKKRSRHIRHIQKRYPGNGYQFLDDDDDDVETHWNQEAAQAAHWDDEQQKQQQQESETTESSWGLGTETTQERYAPEWEATTEPYESSNWETSTEPFWGTSTPYWEAPISSYWETSTQPYWESTTPSYWDTSSSSSWEPSTSDPYWREGAATTLTELEPYWSTTIPTATDIMTTTLAPAVPPPVWDPTPAATEDPIWRRLFVVTPAPTTTPNQPLALPMTNCPHRFDAVTRAFNGRTYVFARDRVYQLWRHDNLHQKASFFVNEMFPDGPRTVTVAYTNQRSGVTVLIEHKTVYRYRWNRKNKVFYLARKSPQPLTYKIPVYPRAGFQWIDGNQVLVEGDNFATYDAYWNVATFSGLTSNYFPQFPRDLIGMTYQNGSLFILYTASNKIQIYDTGKYRVMQEYPIEIGDFVGCTKG